MRTATDYAREAAALELAVKNRDEEISELRTRLYAAQLELHGTKGALFKAERRLEDLTRELATAEAHMDREGV